MATETEVRTEVDRIIELVSDSHEKAKAKGGTTSTPYLLANLPDAIESIPEGITPTGTKTITENGTHDVTNYAIAEVEVAGEDVTAETNAYTTKLAALETQLNALSSELDGKVAGGVLSEAKYVTGTISLSKNNFAAHETVMLIDDLPYKPSHVFIRLDPNSIIDMDDFTGSTRGLLSIESIENTYCTFVYSNFVSNTKVYSASGIASEYVGGFTLLDNGFKLVSNGAMRFGSLYRYVAFSGDILYSGIFDSVQ